MNDVSMSKREPEAYKRGLLTVTEACRKVRALRTLGQPGKVWHVIPSQSRGLSVAC